MTILGIDSSGLVATVALMVDNVLVGEYTIHNKKTHSQTLLPMIDAMLKMAEVDVEKIDAIAVASGPGSFTGLRIGASTAKGMAGALNIPIIAISTLQGLAYNMTGSDKLVCPLMDARRNQAYYGIYRFGGDVPEKCVEDSAAAIEEIVDKLNKMGKPVIFLGDGVCVFREYIENNAKFDFSFATDDKMYQRASSIVALADVFFSEGKQMCAKDFAPTYLRLSQAERERMNRES